MIYEKSLYIIKKCRNMMVISKRCNRQDNIINLTDK